eukprot:scaffold33712_cov57-Attheya_sp.AAC.5
MELANLEIRCAAVCDAAMAMATVFIPFVLYFPLLQMLQIQLTSLVKKQATPKWIGIGRLLDLTVFGGYTSITKKNQIFFRHFLDASHFLLVAEFTTSFQHYPLNQFQFRSTIVSHTVPSVHRQYCEKVKLQMTAEQPQQASDQNDGVIITHRDPKTLHNFGPASPRDQTVFTCERPGGEPADPTAQIPTSVVRNWIVCMKEKGIQHVLILLDDNELECYEPPGLLSLYTDAGLTVHRTPMGEKGASQRVQTILSAAESSGEKVVAHCTHGMGRSGRVAAGWLVMKYGLSEEDATSIAIETAREHGMERMGNVPALEKWLKNS